MIDSHSALVQNFLARPEIHERWTRDYRTGHNESFYEHAFDYILRVLKPSPGATVLDAGCGSCPYSVRLARARLQCPRGGFFRERAGHGPGLCQVQGAVGGPVALH